MKLWILFDILYSVHIPSSDCIITNNYKVRKFYSNNKIIFVDPTYNDEDEELYQSLNKMIQSQRKFLGPLVNAMYMRIFRTVGAIVRTVDYIILNERISTIVLAGGSEYPFYTLVHGEGEGNKFFYRTSWLINPIIYNKYKRSKDLNIEWLKKKPVFVSKITHIVREKIFIAKQLWNEIKRNCSLGNNSHSLQLEKKQIITYTQKPLQLRHIRKLLRTDSDSRFINLTYSNVGNAVLIVKLPFKKIIDIFIKSIRECNNCDSVDFNWNGVQLEIKSNLLSNIIKAEFFSEKMIVKHLDYTLKKYFIKPKCIITNMAFVGELKQINQYCNEKGIEHLNFQYVTNGRILFPEMELADKYFLYSRRTYELCSHYADCYRLYFPINNRVFDYLNSPNEIVIYTQPDWYADRYICFLDNFCKKMSDRKMDYIIKIKPHYRQNKLEEITSFSKKYSFVRLLDKDDDVGFVLQNTLFAMSMTSSVLFEAFTYATPAFIIDIDGLDSKAISQNDDTVECVNFRCKSYDVLFDYLEKKEQTIQEYFLRRESYISSSNSITNIGDCINNF